MIRKLFIVSLITVQMSLLPIYGGTNLKTDSVDDLEAQNDNPKSLIDRLQQKFSEHKGKIKIGAEIGGVALLVGGIILFKEYCSSFESNAGGGMLTAESLPSPQTLFTGFDVDFYKIENDLLNSYNQQFNTAPRTTMDWLLDFYPDLFSSSSMYFQSISAIASNVASSFPIPSLSRSTVIPIG